jgi:hypothetical protein
MNASWRSRLAVALVLLMTMTGQARAAADAKKGSSITGEWVFVSNYPPVPVFGATVLYQAGNAVLGTEYIHGRTVTGVSSGSRVLLIFKSPSEGVYFFLGTRTGSSEMSGVAVHNGVQSPWTAVKGSLAGAL